MRDLLSRIRGPGAPLVPAGLYHFTREVDGQLARYHLRVDADGHGTLIANATNAVVLSPSGVALAHGLLARRPVETVRRIRHAFRGAGDVGRDLAEMQGTLDRLVRAHGGYPLSGEIDARKRALSAPLSADVVVADARRPLEVLRRLWDAGVPHVVLAIEAGAAAPHLPRAVELAEDLGMICGLRARASDLSGTSLVREVAMAGLDHLDLFVASADPARHDALFGDGDAAAASNAVETCHALELCPTAVTPVLSTTLSELSAIAEKLTRERVGAFLLYAIAEAGPGGGQVLGAEALRQVATSAEELADHLDLNLSWAPPVMRDESVPLAEQTRRGPRTASDAGIRVEADGSVIGPVGPHAAAGNVLRDGWAAIWAEPRFTSLRESVGEAVRCDACPGLSLCAGGCPAEPAQWATTGGDAR